jgi:type IV pilus assembly protein PilA
MTAQNFKSQKGFTLIELLVVIGILAILLSITLIAINPARQFATANNTKRTSDVNAVLNAIGQFAAENRGTLPAGAAPGTVLLSACTLAAPCTITNDAAVTPRIDLCQSLTTEFIAQIPGDPTTGVGVPAGDPNCATTYNTGYEVYQSAGTDSRITVTAPDTELGIPDISVTR